jgi:hypothetical protein
MVMVTANVRIPVMATAIRMLNVKLMVSAVAKIKVIVTVTWMLKVVIFAGNTDNVCLLFLLFTVFH